jgi:hypothetical protein
MKFATSVLALGAALCAAPAVHAQTYINEGFAATPTNTPTVTWALGAWNLSGGTLNAIVENNATRTASVAIDSTAITSGLTNIQFTYTSLDAGSGGSANASFTFRIGSRAGNSTDPNAYTYSVPTGFPYAMGSQSTIRFDSDLTFAAGLDYILEFRSTDIRTGDSLSIDDLLVRRVPGPLPILGALAAFGWSRKLRQKIKDAAAVDARAAVVV